MSTEPNKPTVPRATWQQLLADQPPYRWFLVECVRDFDTHISMPELRLHCDACGATMFFRCYEAPLYGASKIEPTVQWAKYKCRNCGQSTRTFGLLFHIELGGPDEGWHIMKIGEHPPFGPHVPARVISLIGPERDQFLKGRRAESLGFGIGAFGYYRRVVESQRDRLLEHIIKAAERTNAPQERIEALRMARAETRFEESMKLAKDSLPEALFIDGDNPLKLLHSALSEGLHALPDEECLAYASAVREVLTALAERLAEVTKEQTSLAAAIKKLKSPGGGKA